MKGTKVDQIEIVANGLKILRVLSADREYAIKIADDFENCVLLVLDLVEKYSDSRAILDEGRETITNMARHQMLTHEFKDRSKVVLGETLNKAVTSASQDRLPPLLTP